MVLVLLLFSPRQVANCHGTESEVCRGMRLRDVVKGNVQEQKKDKESNLYSQGSRLLFQGPSREEIP